MVIQTHNHTYDRTLPIKFNKDNPSEPIVSTTALPSNNSDKDIDYFKDPTNPIFVVVGTGGRSLATLKGELPHVAYRYNKEYGFLNLDVNKEVLTANSILTAIRTKQKISLLFGNKKILFPKDLFIYSKVLHWAGPSFPYYEAYLKNHIKTKRSFS